MTLNLKHPLALVPTMGALHAGHSSLINIAAQRCTEVVVSIFVNPLQFENPDDLAKYPRQIEKDIELAKQSGATNVWIPSLEEIYPNEPEIVSAGKIGNIFEGVHRFGHFDGVLTVVNRLFNLVKPEVAIFGEKDFQQLFLIKKLVKDSNRPIEIIAAPTIRETDGLAMSSRNIRLTEAERIAAGIISKALTSAAKESSLELQRDVLLSLLASEKQFALDYAEIIDEESYEIADSSSVNTRAIVAGWINGVRLLDNMVMRTQVHKMGAR